MSPLLAPLFAQLVTLQVGDRTEARYSGYLHDSNPQASATTAPVVGLGVSHRRANFQVAYAPAFTVAPLDHTPRRLFVFHNGSLGAGYQLRRTTFQLSGSFGVGSLQLRLASVQGPQLPTDLTNGGMTGTPTGGTPPTGTPPTGTPPTGTPPTGMPMTGATPGGVITREPPREQVVRFYTANAAAGMTHRLSKEAQLGATAGTTAGGGLNDDSRVYYQSLRAWFIGANGGYTYTLSRRDAFIGNVALMKTWSSSDNEAATASATETWGHRLGPRTTSALGAGINVTRFSQANGLAGLSVFPTFLAGAAHQVPIGRGQFSFAASAYSNPVLDPLRALVDPRIGLAGSIGYTRKKLALLTSGSAGLSVAPDGNKRGAINATQAEARASYQLGDLVTIDTGGRLAYQSYEGQAAINTTWAAFVGLTFGYRVILAGGR